MPLNKQITQSTISTNEGNNTFDLQNLDFKWELESFTGIETSLGGNLLSQNTIAGKRLFVDINWEQNIEPSTVNDVIDSIYADMIYNSATGLTLFPDASETANEFVADYQGGGLASNVITITNHGLKSGQRVVYSDVNVTVTGLTLGEAYYVRKVSNNSFALSSIIAGNDVTLTAISGTGDFLLEQRSIEMVPLNLDEVESYRNTIGSYIPSLSLKSFERYVITPTVFGNV